MAASVEFDMSFLNRHPVGQARLFLDAPDGSRYVIQTLNISLLNCQGSLVNFYFEISANGTPTANIAVPSIAAGVALVRFIYTKNYGSPSSQNDAPLLLTAHVFVLAHRVDYEELYHEARTILLGKVNYAADYPSPPSDLCATIRFLWAQTWATKELLSIKGDILNYCVTAFEKHDLGSNPEFIKLSEEHVNFHMDLSKTNFDRGYEQAGIMKLPDPDRSPLRPLEEDFYIASVFSSHSDEDSIDSDDDIDSADGTYSEDEESDGEDLCTNGTVAEVEEGDGQDFSCATIVNSAEEGETEDSSSTIDVVYEDGGEADGEDISSADSTVTESDETDGDNFSRASDVISEDDEEGDGEDFSSADGIISEGEKIDGKDFSRVNDVISDYGEECDFASADGTISEGEEIDGQDFSRANDVISDDEEEGEGDGDGNGDDGDKQPAFLFNVPMRPKPNSQADTEFATAPTSPTSEASFVVVDSSVQSTLGSESDSDSEWQVL